MWYAYLIGDKAMVNKFSEALATFDHDTCSYYLVYASKFHSEGAPKPSIPTQH
jgi:hypothetical protein